MNQLLLLILSIIAPIFVTSCIIVMHITYIIVLSGSILLLALTYILSIISIAFMYLLLLIIYIITTLNIILLLGSIIAIVLQKIFNKFNMNLLFKNSLKLFNCKIKISKNHYCKLIQFNNVFTRYYLNIMLTRFKHYKPPAIILLYSIIKLLTVQLIIYQI